MQSQQSRSIAKGARFVTKELIRQPVKEAVREALREEAAVVKSDRSGSPERVERSSGQSGESSDGDGSIVSKLGMAALAMGAMFGLVYVTRKIRGKSDQSTWTQPTTGDQAAGSGSYESGSETSAAEATASSGATSGEGSASGSSGASTTE